MPAEAGLAGQDHTMLRSARPRPTGAEGRSSPSPRAPCAPRSLRSDEGGLSMGLPQGTVTFLFTDLEGSTRLWEAHPQEMKDALARHNTIVRAAVESHNGVVFSTMGDGMAAV